MEKQKWTNNIGHNLRMVHIGIDKFFNCHSLEDLDVKPTHAQSGMMHYLYDHRDEDVFQKDLEKCFQISGATASNTLKGMEKQGIIVRTPLEEDGRKKKLTLTPLGIEFHERALANLKLLENTLVEGMTEEEITIYRDLLRRSAQNLEGLNGSCGDKK